MILINSIFDFLEELREFSYEMSVSDRIWNIRFPDPQEQWHHLHISQYQSTFYMTHVEGKGGCLEVEPRKSVQVMESMGMASSYPFENYVQLIPIWESLIPSARRWLKTVRQNWIRANYRMQADYPLQYRYGIVSNALIRASLPDIYRLDTELGTAKTRKLVRLVEEGFFMKAENTEVSSMTAADYFQYCKIAYIAGKEKGEKIDDSLSGREMYTRYADGRHEGLLDIDPNSEQEFTAWIDGTHPKRLGGGHPWEIKRGGNTTHINLAVFRPSPYRKEGFKIELRGESIGRMVETMRMLLAIHAAKLPISIANPESVRKRLLGQDNIGIIPSYVFSHRANQHFDRDQEVFDVMHYNDLGRYKRRITPFITWEPLTLLRPREI